MKTVAIIVNHNDGENLNRLVNSIKEYRNLDTIIVVDNASEEPINLVEDNKVIILYAPKNGGYGYGNNIGLNKAKELGADYAVIANPDTEWDSDCVSSMTSELEKGASVCAPMCITPDSSYASPISAWPIRPWHLELFDRGPLCRRLFKNQINYSKKFFATTGVVDVGAVLGSLLAVDVNKVLEVGAYDENVFLYCEENILGFKLKEHGYKTMLLRDKTYLHSHKPALPSKQSIHNLRDSELYYFEHYLKVGKFKLWISKVFWGTISFELSLLND